MAERAPRIRFWDKQHDAINLVDKDVITGEGIVLGKPDGLASAVLKEFSGVHGKPPI
jgi:hypothetical protein